jgi:hypothetical protein
MVTFDKLEQMFFPKGPTRVIKAIPKCNHYLISIVISDYLNLTLNILNMNLHNNTFVIL